MDVSIRPVEDDDLELLLAWLNHPDVYETLAHREEEIAWEDHAAEYRGRGDDREDWMILAADGDERRVGTVKVTDMDSDAPRTEILIGELGAWGEGIATDALRALFDELRERGYGAVRADILPWNDPTIRLYEDKLGFAATDEETERGETVFKRDL